MIYNILLFFFCLINGLLSQWFRPKDIILLINHKQVHTKNDQIIDLKLQIFIILFKTNIYIYTNVRYLTLPGV